MWQYFPNKHHQFQLVCEFTENGSEKREKMYLFILCMKRQVEKLLFLPICENHFQLIDAKILMMKSTFTFNDF